MKTVGFEGGGSIRELGSASDVALFFDCIRAFPAFDSPEENWDLLTDRLYKRYLRLEELDAASSLMVKAKEVFNKTQSTAVKWNPQMIGNPESTRLNPNQPTLGEVFSKYFEHFSHCVESAKLSYEGFKSYPGYVYEPVKTVITDLSIYANETKRPLQDYDDLEGQPFWMAKLI